MPKVLVVDDEKDILVLMRKILGKWGYKSLELANSKKALKAAKKGMPDAVILDIMMPEIDGWEVCKQLKSDPKTRNLPIIMLTVLAEEKDRKKSFECGADWHISAPFDTDHLLFILNTYAGNKEWIGEKIEEAIKRDDRMKKVLEMINPKLLEHDYRFLD